jgi:predicted N-acetyltransferase YhbS
MALILRPGRPADATVCGTICYEAFKAIAKQHNFSPSYPSPRVATARMAERLAHPGFYAVIAELDGRVVGSNFLDERSTIIGLGPVTVDPAVQNSTIGRQLMQNALDRAAARHSPGVRLMQSTYQNRSLCLYANLGFEVRELLAKMQGAPLSLHLPGYTVRSATVDDIDACDHICFHVHGHDRSGELRDAITQGTATVVERGGRISGYATVIGVPGHAVGETNDDVKALIGAAPEFVGAGFYVPVSNGELFRWCLAHGLRMVVPMTLMSLGLYNEPAGAFLPSILY